jgi:hypothetical protein
LRRSTLNPFDDEDGESDVGGGVSSMPPSRVTTTSPTSAVASESGDAEDNLDAVATTESDGACTLSAAASAAASLLLGHVLQQPAGAAAATGSTSAAVTVTQSGSGPLTSRVSSLSGALRHMVALVMVLRRRCRVLAAEGESAQRGSMSAINLVTVLQGEKAALADRVHALEADARERTRVSDEHAQFMQNRVHFYEQQIREADEQLEQARAAWRDASVILSEQASGAEARANECTESLRAAEAQVQVLRAEHAAAQAQHARQIARLQALLAGCEQELVERKSVEERLRDDNALRRGGVGRAGQWRTHCQWHAPPPDGRGRSSTDHHGVALVFIDHDVTGAAARVGGHARTPAQCAGSTCAATAAADRHTGPGGNQSYHSSAQPLRVHACAAGAHSDTRCVSPLSHGLRLRDAIHSECDRQTERG